MYPDWELNRQPFGSQTDTQSPEPCQPGQIMAILTYLEFSTQVAEVARAGPRSGHLPLPLPS